MTELLLGRRTTVAEDVANTVLAQISAGRYQPGDRLPTEPELARQFGVGRTSIREGLAKLRMLGAVEVRRGLGTFVADGESTDPRLGFIQWTAEHLYQIVDIFEVRISLETTAAALAVSRASDADLNALEEKARAHDEAAHVGDLEALVRTDQEFHAAALACSHNEALTRVYAVLVPELVPYRSKSLALHNAPTRSAADHLAIVDAIRSRDPALAHAAVLKHLSVLYEEIVTARDDHGTVDLSPWPAPRDPDPPGTKE